jgi:hypothetical protein
MGRQDSKGGLQGEERIHGSNSKIHVQSSPKKGLTETVRDVSFIHMLSTIEGNGMAKRLNFYLTDAQVKRLRIMSTKSCLTASEILRRAIDEYWERFDRKEKWSG